MKDVAGHRENLRRLILEKALKRGEFLLASGKRSSYYIDCKNVTLHPEGLKAVCTIFLDFIEREFSDVTAAGGPTLGADPVVGGMVAMSPPDRPLKGFIIRKEPKKHGRSKWIEGIENLSAGEKVVLVEDVVTTGGTSLKSLERAREAGLNVRGIFAIVDREEGAEEKFRNVKVAFHPIFKTSELLDVGK